MTRRPYLCSKQIVWELDSFLMEKIFFVPINFGLSIRAFRGHEALVSSRVACKAKMHDYIMLMESLGFVCGLLLGNCGCQTDRMIYEQSEIALRLRSSRDKRTARATKL